MISLKKRHNWLFRSFISQSRKLRVTSPDIAVGKQNSFEGHEESARMFKTKYFQMDSAFSKKKDLH